MAGAATLCHRAVPPCAESPGVHMGEFQESQGIKREDLREREIVLGLSCDLEEKLGTLLQKCQHGRASPPWSGLAWVMEAGHAGDWFFFF